MLSRRILRIKAMQVLYSNAVGKNISPVLLEKVLNSYIDKANNLYFIFLAYLVEVSQYAVVDAAKRASKHIVKEEDKNVSTLISENSIIAAIKNHPAYRTALEEKNLHGFIDKKTVKKLYNKLIASEKYQTFTKAEKSIENDIDILRYITKKVIGTSESLEEDLDEHFINLEDDHFITLHSLQKKIKEYSAENEAHFLNTIFLKTDKEEDVIFARNLLGRYLDFEDEFEADIAPRLKNWDSDRVAVLDMILLKMAICEFKHFPFIPTKVSINEYIDISKEYSTQKSKDFINGILDKTMRDLKDKGEIKKQGRGLINN